MTQYVLYADLLIPVCSPWYVDEWDEAWLVSLLVSDAAHRLPASQHPSLVPYKLLLKCKKMGHVFVLWLHLNPLDHFLLLVWCRKADGWSSRELPRLRKDATNLEIFAKKRATAGRPNPALSSSRTIAGEVLRRNRHQRSTAVGFWSENKGVNPGPVPAGHLQEPSFHNRYPDL